MGLNLVQVEEISALLLQVPPLVDHLENRAADFADGVRVWLKRAETILENHRQPAASQLAACRAMLQQAARGAHWDDIRFVGKPTVRKILDATGSLVLQRSNEILHDVIKERQAVFRDAEKLANQLVVVAEAKGLLASCRSIPNHQAFLECVRGSISADPDLISGYTHLVALVGKIDTLIFLDRAIVE